MIQTQSTSQPFVTMARNAHHELQADAPVNKGGGAEGFGAHELLEAALAACLNMAVRMCAAEHSIPLESVATRVNLHRPNPETVSFEYAVYLVGPLSDDHRRQLEQAASTCPVRQTLSKRLEFIAME